MSLLIPPMVALAALIQVPTPSPIKKESPVPTHIHGTFDVKVTPQPAGDPAGPWVPGRMALDKRFHGELEATSQGEMLAVRTEVKGSAGYVAIERVTGALKGRKGTFLLQHSGLMDRGEGRLAIAVVPDSGTEALKGLAGRMDIVIKDGQHYYDFEFTLPGL